MAFCPNCGAQLTDDMAFCGECGTPAGVPVTLTGTASTTTAKVKANDHTAEFDPDDIKRERVYATFSYLFGLFGIIITELACKKDGFALFHVRQILKLVMAGTLFFFAWLLVGGIIGGLLLLLKLTNVFAVVGAILIWLETVATIFFGVLFIICLINAFRGKAKDVPIISALPFL